MLNEIVEGTVRRAQFAQTLSISHPFKKLTISGEIWHFSQPFPHGDAIGNLWAVSYPVRKNLVVDGGFNRGLPGLPQNGNSLPGLRTYCPIVSLNIRANGQWVEFICDLNNYGVKLIVQ